MKKYAMVKDAEIIKFRNVPDDDLLIIAKLDAHGYLPVEEDVAPECDYATQTIADSYEVQENRVLRQWTVTERSFVEAKNLKKSLIETDALDKIRVVFDDVDKKAKVDQILDDKDASISEVEAAKDNTDLQTITVGI